MGDGINPRELPECEEGPRAARRFEQAMRKIVGVSKDELKRREKAWRKARRTKQNRRKAKSV